MADKSLDDPGMTRAMLVLTMLEAIVVEVALIITLSHSSERHSPAGLVLMLATIFVSSVPAVAGIMGYRAADKLRSSLEAASKGNAAIQLSRQFLGITAAAYAAIMVTLVTLGELLRAK